MHSIVSNDNRYIIHCVCWYLTNLSLSQYMTQGFIFGEAISKNSLSLQHSPYWGAASAKLSTQLCKAGIAWKEGSLRSSKLLNTTNPRWSRVRAWVCVRVCVCVCRRGQIFPFKFSLILFYSFGKNPFILFSILINSVFAI